MKRLSGRGDLGVIILRKSLRICRAAWQSQSLPPNRNRFFEIGSIAPFFTTSLFIALLFFVSCKPSYSSGKLKEGDIIFQTSLSSQSRAIQLATHSKYSHMGILFKENGKYFVLEAVQPVKLTTLEAWTQRGKDQHYVVKRLKNADQLINEKVIKKMKEIGLRYKGKRYDSYFEWSDDKIYCSELVWKIYKKALGIEIGKLKKLREFDLSNPAVQAKLKERFGQKIPLEEPVISPASMFESDLLETI